MTKSQTAVEKGRKRVRFSGPERRAMILEAATALISARGYNALTLARLAEECEMTNAGMLHYFASKQDLLVAVLDHQDESNERFLAEIGVDGSTREGARAFMDRLIDRDAGCPEIVRLYTILGAESLDPSHPAHQHLVDRARRIRERAVAMTANWHPDPERFVTMVDSFHEGIQLAWLRDPSIDLRAAWRDFADLVFGARP
ncbi:MAG: TetR/AcrR family transcriptional regulator [Bifidobacteriaceae bacterium]|jgi:AcrR family transcriptional regulator|nr:TetR/AcrR family transcriptional regulator [Bifidobacteriaceae bacterium]